MQTLKKIHQAPLLIKCGGSIINNVDELSKLLKDLSQLKALGYPIILLHGGGPDINQLCAQLNLTSTFSQGLRVTTAEILAVTQMALLGKTNCGLVHKLNQNNILALGVSGHDANLLIADFIDQDKLGYVGEISAVNTPLLDNLLNLGIIPVIAPLAIDKKGNTLNINADLAAAAVAVAMKAQQLILLSDIDGYYANYPDPTSLVKILNTLEVAQLLADSTTVSDGMRPKLSACLNAVNGGVSLAQIVNGNLAQSLLTAVQNPLQIGTSIIKGASSC
jgi:acetylglutamate kinase